jgi:hypothetical protein
MCMFVKVVHGSTRVHKAKEDSLHISASGAFLCNAIRLRARVPDRFGMRVFRYVPIRVAARSKQA